MIFRLSLQQNQLLTKNFKKMRRTILTLVAVATLGLFMISCGGSGVGKSGISNKYLGKYPGLMADKAKQKEEIREAYRYAESRSDVVKITKKEDKFKEEWKAAIEKELTSLIGKEIPTEVKDFPVKVSKNATIKALSTNKEYLTTLKTAGSFISFHMPSTPLETKSLTKLAHQRRTFACV